VVPLVVEISKDKEELLLRALVSDAVIDREDYF
jgi:hypothetical protein